MIRANRGTNTLPVAITVRHALSMTTTVLTDVVNASISVVSSTASSVTTITANEYEITAFCEPCARNEVELVLFVFFGFLIIVSNLVCIRVSYLHTSVHHPENKYFVLNLAVCNLLCGCALLVSSGLDYLLGLRKVIASEDDTVNKAVCMVWCPIYKTCVMVPYVAVATLGFDIAFYCHHSMDYHRFMSCKRLVLMLVASWLYTFVVVGAIMVSDPNVFCSERYETMNPFNILFPILLMFLPATLLVSLFIFIICRHWRASHTLTPHVGNIQCDEDTAAVAAGNMASATSATLQSQVTISKRSGSVCTYASRSRKRLVGRFIAKFLHLIIFSIICALVITFLTVAEVVLEHTDGRYCIIFVLDRLFISFNSLLGPWIYCFAAKRYRKGLRRRLSSMLGTPSRKHTTSEFTITARPS